MILLSTQYKSKNLLMSNNHWPLAPALLLMPFLLWQPHCSSNKSITHPSYSLCFSFSFCLECSSLVIKWLITLMISVKPTLTTSLKSEDCPHLCISEIPDPFTFLYFFLFNSIYHLLTYQVIYLFLFIVYCLLTSFNLLGYKFHE